MTTAWALSPYRPGNGIDPPYLGDREEQIEAVRAFLRNPRHPRNVLITGLRGVGKTVLLNRIQAEAEASGWIVVDREFSEPDAEPHAFASAVLTDVNRALRRLSLSARLKDRAGQMLQAAIDLVGALTVSYGEFRVNVDTQRLRGELERRPGAVGLAYSQPHAQRYFRGAAAQPALDADAVRATASRRQPLALEDLLGADVCDPGARQPSAAGGQGGFGRPRGAPGAAICGRGGRRGHGRQRRLPILHPGLRRFFMDGRARRDDFHGGPAPTAPAHPGHPRRGILPGPVCARIASRAATHAQHRLVRRKRDDRAVAAGIAQAKQRDPTHGERVDPEGFGLPAGASPDRIHRADVRRVLEPHAQLIGICRYQTLSRVLTTWVVEVSIEK